MKLQDLYNDIHEIEGYGNCEWDRRPVYNRTRIIYDLVRDGSSVLDIGCGNGELLYNLMKNKNAKVLGVDFSIEALKKAKSKINGVLLCDLNIGVCINERFDYVILEGVLEHLIDPDHLLMESSKLLNKNGSLIISIPNICCLKNRVHMVFGKFSNMAACDYREHLHCFNSELIKNILSKCGFEIVLQKGVGRLGYLYINFAQEIVFETKLKR